MKNHIFRSFSLIRAQRAKILRFGAVHDIKVRFGVEEVDKYQNNVRNVFRDIKLPLENIMG